MKNFQRGFILPLLLTVLAVLVVSGGAYWYLQSKNTLETPSHQSTNITRPAAANQNNNTNFSASPISGSAPFAGLTMASSTESGEWCRNGLFTSDSKTFVLVQVAAASTSLRIDTSFGAWSCPGSDKCSGKKLPPGQDLLVNKQMGNFLCAYDPVSNEAGWIPISDVAIKNPQPPAAPALTDWVGLWENYNKITITLSGAMLHAEGSAGYPSLENAEHVGSFSADASPIGAQVVFDENLLNLDPIYQCRVVAKLAGPYLVVTDNEKCGGTNVRFDGVYIKQKS